MTLREKIGQMIVTGFMGETMSPEFVELVKENKVANAILFSHNARSRSQLKELCASLQNIVEEETGVRAFIAMDEEGGVVTRLPADSLHIPGAMAIASSGNKDEAYLAAFLTGRELKRLGVNFNLAPVLDINSNVGNPVIGVRSFGSDAFTVSKYGCAMVSGFLDAGVMCSLKHFPGHGDTAVDSHLTLPRVDKSYEELKNSELIPFQNAFKEGALAVTLAHILFPKIEKERIPVTMSRTLIRDILREDMGFKGLIISDCMEMKAIKEFYGTAVGAKNAVKAGVDLIFISHTAQRAREAASEIERAVEGGEIPMERIDEAVQKILYYKGKYVLPRKEAASECAGDGVSGTSGQLHSEREFCRRLTYKTVHYTNREAGYRHKLGKKPLFLGCGAYGSTLASSALREDLLFPDFLSRSLWGEGILFSVQPEAEEIENIRKRVREGNYTDVVAGTYNGHLNKGQIDLVHRLEGCGLPMVMVALRNPYDLDLVDDTVDKIAAFEYTQWSFMAVAGLLG